MTEHQREHQDDAALRKLSTDARVEARMLDDNTPITDAQRDALLQDLRDYKARNEFSQSKLAELTGLSTSVVSQMLSGTYTGDVPGTLRKIDQFLANERKREASPRSTARQFIGVLEMCRTTSEEAINCNTMAVITGEHGIGKTWSAQWIRDRNSGAVLITCDDKDCDENFIIDALYEALKIGSHATHRRHKKREIVDHLRTHRNVIVIVDESQKLTRAALELLRSIHDQSDSDGRRCTPMILFADNDFYKLVVAAKGKSRQPRRLLSPQISSRLYPVVSLEGLAGELDGSDGGGNVLPPVYSFEDIQKIFNSNRVRLVRREALDWVRRLANVAAHGRLRLATRVVDVAERMVKGKPITVDILTQVLTLFVGPNEARLVQDEIKDQPAAPVAIAG